MLICVALALGGKGRGLIRISVWVGGGGADVVMIFEYLINNGRNCNKCDDESSITGQVYYCCTHITCV